MVVVATWNLENLYLPGGDGPKDQPSYDAKLNALKRTIDDIAPDVLAVQEVGDPDALDDLAGRVGGKWYQAVSTKPGDRGIRVAILSRHPVTVTDDSIELPPALRPIQVSDQPAKPSHELSRGVLAVTVEPVAGVSLTVITCHLKSKLLSFPGHHFDTHDEGQRARYGAYALYRRAAEATAVREIATKHLHDTPDTPVIVLGDLNDEPTAATTQILNGPTGSEIGTTGFNHPDNGDRWRLWTLAPLIPDNERFSRIYRGRKELIDHIFASHQLLKPLPTVHTIAQHGLPSITDNPTAHRNDPGSDHSPVVATFDLS